MNRMINKDMPMNYYCTWAQQCHIGGGTTGGRDALDHDRLFGENGWCKCMYPSIRNRLLFLLDDGWELPYSHGDASIHNKYFGSQNVFEDKFPGYGRLPQERLKTLVDNIKACGWAGVGIWICASEEESVSKKLAKDQFEPEYWKTRLMWSKFSGIAYWKVDWGRLDHNTHWRRWLSKIASEIYPELIIEHTDLEDPLSDPFGCGGLTEEKLKINSACLGYSDVYRTYDVSWALSSATTFDRVGELLCNACVQENGSMGYINCEDELYLAAVLGLNMGIMRNPTDQDSKDEIVRALNWQRLAPAYPANLLENKMSEEWLYDAWDFEQNDTWQKDVIGHRIVQRAPAAISRGTALAKVTGNEDIPFVAAAKNPSGAFAVGTYCRTKPDYPRMIYAADVTVDAGDADTVGIFGEYKSLTVLNSNISGRLKILAGDLLSDKLFDITDEVKISDGRLVLPGSLIQKIGLCSSTPNDNGKPGMLLKIESQNS